MNIYSLLYNFQIKNIYIKILKSYHLTKDLFRNQITYYPESVIEFENKFANYIGVNYCLTFCNGTSSLEAALYALNIPNNSKIGLPSCIFHSDIDAVRNSQLAPHFIDIESNSTSISLPSLEEAIASGVKALIVPHLFGIVKNIEEISRICKLNNIYLIEDCSHAHGASYKGKKAGSFGDISFFSLQGAKPIAAGEGGAALTNDIRYFIRMSAFSHFGRHSFHYDTDLSPYATTGIGHKHRAHPLGIRLALVDLEHLDNANKKIYKNFVRVSKIIDSKLFSVVRPDIHGKLGGVFSGLQFVNNTKLSTKYIQETFLNEGINVDLYPYQMHHQMSIYNLDSFSSCKNTEKMADKLLFLNRRYLEYLPGYIVSRISRVIGRIENEIAQ